MTSQRMRATRRVGLVVDEEVAAVIGAVGERQMRMVGVAVVIDRRRAVCEELPGRRQQPFGQDLAAFVGQAPAGGAAAVEDRDAHQLAHRRQAEDADLAGLAAAAEDVIFVELAGLHLGALSGCAAPCCAPSRRRRQHGGRPVPPIPCAGARRRRRPPCAEQLASADGASSTLSLRRTWSCSPSLTQGVRRRFDVRAGAS